MSPWTKLKRFYYLEIKQLVWCWIVHRRFICVVEDNWHCSSCYPCGEELYDLGIFKREQYEHKD